jgi:rare lipoprotein A
MDERSMNDATDIDRPRRAGPQRRLPAMALIVALFAAAPSVQAERAEHGIGDVASAIGRGVGMVQEGVVSWYGAAFHDRLTASGERFDSSAMTMAHPTLPFGTKVRVTNLRNGRSVVVRVNDRGPFVGKRIADLSHAAAAEIGLLRRGVGKARIEVLGKAD